MWTPKRIVMLVASFLLFSFTFVCYGFSSIGRIDGLPPLPAIYYPGGGGSELPERPEGPSALELRLETAFGKGCPEMNRAIRLDVRSRGMLLSAENFTVMEDGRVSLTPISVALFSKDSRSPEINIIKGDVAYIKFDRPVRNFSEIGSRKIDAAELAGKISIVNNRKRKERDQDLRITIPLGPLYFEEKSHKIWTYDHIEVRDHKSQPEPHIVKGKGMEMELATEQQPGKARDSFSGVKWLSLQAEVDITLHTDGKQNFFDTSVSPESRPSGPAPKQSIVRVTTPGRFRYDMNNKGSDVATFDTPPPPTSNGPSAAPQVRVHRQNFGPPSNDRLACTKLRLTVRRRDSKSSTKEAAGGESVRVETIHATGPDGEVVLTSDAEKLDARGGDFFHDTLKGITILKGNSGVLVLKDSSEIRAAELELQKRPAAPARPGQPVKDSYDVRAVGPGRLHFRDDKEKRSLHAFWIRLLTMTRDKQEDLITLIGEARFVDELGDQNLSADELKVWLDPEQPRPAGVRTDNVNSPTGGRRPRHLEANRNVKVRSKEMNITENNRLVVWFQDEPQAKLPTETKSIAPETSKLPAVAPTTTAPKPVAPGTPILGAPTVPGQPPRPFDLKARSIQARVIRATARNSIDELFCEGAVAITQAPLKTGEKGTEIKGDTLKMNAAPNQCYVLDVVGDTAELHTQKISILGPQVVIDQHRNMAWVVGDGAMTMESATNFQGDKLKSAVPLNVLWKDRMFFDGSSAEFHGDIQATQDNSRLECQRMQVTFDRVVQLKAGNKSDQTPRVRYMVCSKEAKVEETVLKGKEFVKYQRLEGTGLTMQALEVDEGVKVPGGKTTAGNRVTTTGPGSFRVVESGDSDNFDPLGATNPKTVTPPTSSMPKKTGMKMTYVAFQDLMDANSNTGMAAFYKNVRVLHLPVSSADVKVDLNAILARELPEGGLYLRGDRLKVMDRATDGKPNKRMVAEGSVRVQGRDFDASADVVMYDEAKDQIAFESKEGTATLRKFETQGGQPQVVSAKRILYNRRTKEIKTERTNSIHGETFGK